MSISRKISLNLFTNFSSLVIFNSPFQLLIAHLVNFLLLEFLTILNSDVNSVLKYTVVKSRPSCKLLDIPAYLAGKLIACAADVYQSAVNFYCSAMLESQNSRNFFSQKILDVKLVVRYCNRHRKMPRAYL